MLLGTVALEPNRWGGLDRSRCPTVAVSRWLRDIADAGFDGIEVWEGHVSGAAAAEVDAVVGGPLPVSVFNSYVGFDDDEPGARDDVARWVRRAGSTAVKFNVGDDPGSVGAYGERVGAWLATMPADVRLLCECHEGVSVAEDPAVAATILAAAGPPDRVQAVVHTHEEPDHLKARFDAYGDRIGHVHVNFLSRAGAPRLVDERDRLAARVELLRALGYTGTWTIEFVHGVLTDRDEPGALVVQAADDLAVLRDVLA